MFHSFRHSLFAGLLLAFSSVTYAYGIECDKPPLNTSNPGVPTAFSFTCTNHATSAKFTSYEIWPVDTTTTTVTSIACPAVIAPGNFCTIDATFEASAANTYAVDFNDRFGGETHPSIFCNDSEQGCIEVVVPPYAYVTNLDDDTVSKCIVDAANGKLSGCGAAANGFSGPAGITFTTLNGQSYAYVANYTSSNVSRCLVSTTGVFSGCSITGGHIGTSTAPLGVAIHASGNQPYAYVSNNNNNGHIYKCTINTSTGLFDNSCATSGAPFSTGAALLTIETFDNQPYVYVPDGEGSGGGTNVYQCPLDISGNLPVAACPDSGAEAVFASPIGIAFANFGSKSYAYVTSWNGSSSGTYVSICDVDVNTGQLNQSNPTCNRVLSSVTFNEPLGIATLEMNNKMYLYITNQTQGSVYLCTIQPDGSLTACGDSGAGLISSRVFDITFY